MNTTHEKPAAKFAATIFSNETVIYGNSRSEIVDQLLPEHANIREGVEGDEERFLLRLESLQQLASLYQAVEATDLTLEELNEDALTILLHDRSCEVVEFTEWDSDIPLYLLSTTYAPFTERVAPTGESIVWLNAHTETTFLESLERAGAIKLFEKDDKNDQ